MKEQGDEDARILTEPPPYATHWAWLKPVIDEIHKFSLVHDEARAIKYLSIAVDIQTAFEHCCNFINWHNSLPDGIRKDTVSKQQEIIWRNFMQDIRQRDHLGDLFLKNLMSKYILIRK